jgi:hypothetical protein
MGVLVYFDCPAGAAGDMILAALVDAGVSFDALCQELGKLPVSGWTLRQREVRRGAFRALKVDVDLAASAEPPHRTLPEVLGVLERSGLSARVKAAAGRIFRRLAEAEARVHGTTPETVQFHDVGAVDALVDVTGAVVALELLGADAVYVSALPVGGGFAQGPHGSIPIPAPGTLELLRGFPLVDPGVPAELVTPTGAAILSTLARGAGRMPSMRLQRVGYGAGTRELAIPNVLRCLVGDAAEPESSDTVAELETTIDDMSPQLYEPLMERLFERGALDVFLTPVLMKRTRPGVVVTVLCAPEAVEGLARVLFEDSSTLGVRWSERRRLRLERQTVSVETPWGPIPVKVGRLEGRAVTLTPEFREVVRIARERSLSVREVLERARAEARQRLAPGERSQR